jgi:hypothetical protein
MRIGETKEKRPTFDPDSEFFRNWDIFTTVLLIFTALVTPFEVAYLVGRCRLTLSDPS